MQQDQNLLDTPKKKAFQAQQINNMGSPRLRPGLGQLPRMGSVTFLSQLDLKDQKRLPIPALEETLANYIVTIAPLVSPQALEATKALVNEFMQGPGPQLHQQLIEYAKDKNSYIEEFWDAAYLEYDVPIPINVNPVFCLEDDPTPSRTSLIPRAVSLIYSSLKFIRALRNENLPPDQTKQGALCMDQYRRLFGSARVPDPSGKDADVVVNSPLSTHIIVLCKGQFYYFDCIHPDGEIAVTERELNKTLTMIVADAEKSDNDMGNHGVGVLTCESRGRWRKLRALLSDVSMNNRKSLEMIDSGLFVVCLDVDYKPEHVSQACANFLHGTYVMKDGRQVGTLTSRWYDKLQLIICKGGTAGVNFEHSAVDGHTVLRYASDAFTDTVIRFAQTISGGVASHLEARAKEPNANKPRIDSSPRKLEFELTSQLKSAMMFAESRLADSILQNETTTLEYSDFGKLFLVQNNLSPDACVQIAIQTAYFQLYGEPANTYESVLTKAFFHGRTEAGRSCRRETVDFMKAYVDQAPARDLVNLLRLAAQAHSKMTTQASQGKGVDRHLYAMECLCAKLGQPLPQLFKDQSYKTLGTSVLSTSNCGNPSLRFFGFGPVCPQGFGVGYIIKDDFVHLMITSKHRQTERYKNEIAKCLSKMHDDLIACTPVEPIQRVTLKVFRKDSHIDLSEAVEEENGYDFFGLNAAPNLSTTPVGKRLMG